MNESNREWIELSREANSLLRESTLSDCQFRQYEVNTPENNVVQFQRSFFGLDDATELGEVLLDQLVGTEVSWSVQSLGVNIRADLAYFVVTTRLGPCPSKNCEPAEDFVFLVVMDAASSFVRDYRVGDYFHVTGELVVLLNAEGSDLPAHQRMAVRADKLLFFNGGAHWCDEVLERSDQP